MLQNISTIEYKHKKFIERVVDHNTVWSLESAEGFATSGSNHFEDTTVIPFWSDKAYALAMVKEDWAHYQPVSMPLSDFVENWLVGMDNDGHLAGTNWDANMCGKETEPLELALEIVDELLTKGKELTFSNYKDISDYQTQVRNVLDAD